MEREEELKMVLESVMNAINDNNNTYSSCHSTIHWEFCLAEYTSLGVWSSCKLCDISCCFFPFDVFDYSEKVSIILREASVYPFSEHER